MEFTNLQGNTSIESLSVESLTHINDFVVGQRVSSEDSRVVDGFVFNNVGADGDGAITVEFRDDSNGNPVPAVNAFGLNEDGEAVTIKEVLDQYDITELNVDSDGDIVGFDTLDHTTLTGDNVEVGSNYVQGQRTYSNTPVYLYNANNDKVEGIYTWGEIEDFDEISAGATIYHSQQQEGVADYIVVERNQTNITAEEEGTFAVVDRVWLNAAGTEVRQIRVLENGSLETYRVRSGAITEDNVTRISTEIDKGTIVNLAIDNNGVVIGEFGFGDVDQAVVSGTVTDATNNNRTFNITGDLRDFQLEGNGYVIDARDEDNSPSVVNFSTLVNELENDLVVDVLLGNEEARFADIVVIRDSADVEDDDDEEVHSITSQTLVQH
ncbi:hypothetical protein [Geomicrobium sp. JCM 19055]|uniref:hypothetical protein n=1 Tax=Geomicrobium sp. JCM 19055 TaxID=1460649 RepID=UPI00045ECF8B|nr:hypothetical protein [Geomicrobium sp. JCM 19055]GAJ97358.1 hypothetical protein JCM19055_210 [Geomicrobium sp. JCM 19055]